MVSCCTTKGCQEEFILRKGGQALEQASHEAGEVLTPEVLKRCVDVVLRDTV